MTSWYQTVQVEGLMFRDVWKYQKLLISQNTVEVDSERVAKAKGEKEPNIGSAKKLKF